MRISRIDIGRWRNLAGLEIVPDPNADFICVVGENGAGKTNILDLIAYSATELGLTSGGSSGRCHPPPPSPSR